MLIILLTLFAFPPAACAYLDLTTGSYFFQIALGTILGLVVSFRQRIKHVFWSITNKCCPDKTADQVSIEVEQDDQNN
ncbi:MAG: hypothetical protein K2Y22_12940 [Candidatus Obscuribacterales bacterium]|nr:hypothetical protein [Candidatus Obscuribacterales bacterium]